jgi:hypothetical protein
MWTKARLVGEDGMTQTSSQLAMSVKHAHRRPPPRDDLRRACTAQILPPP